MNIHYELTDTFGGEANYSWVKRHAEQAEDTCLPSDRTLIRRAKAWAGFTGLRCRVENYGDLIAIRPSGICQVLFITFDV